MEWPKARWLPQESEKRQRRGGRTLQLLTTGRTCPDEGLRSGGGRNCFTHDCICFSQAKLKGFKGDAIGTTGMIG